MSLEWKMVDAPYRVTLYGFSRLRRPEEAVGAVAMELLGRLWEEILGKHVTNRGLSHLIYDADGTVFAGVELADGPAEEGQPAGGMSRRTLSLGAHAYCVHRGPYAGLGATYDALLAAVAEAGRSCRKPLLEKYGHWQEDESQLETEIYFSLT
ncbi:GyrI-like domain-containing protein [Paenibacillus sp. MWE-103]|uniref:GyrI-like domain-containing protein n=1 Tax=Paenibacillus artemisiicola TaxID=1172618 RepID=A0ABS3W2V9_9BACL|nr:GyrI-like domain-containing protein [Paenibacillus artemisiicola]MBO7742634.1 GyrI-like domain-containing protein [Paenibacillus artemisiicola]